MSSSYVNVNIREIMSYIQDKYANDSWLMYFQGLQCKSYGKSK